MSHTMFAQKPLPASWVLPFCFFLFSRGFLFCGKTAKAARNPKTTKNKTSHTMFAQKAIPAFMGPAILFFVSLFSWGFCYFGDTPKITRETQAQTKCYTQKPLPTSMGPAILFCLFLLAFSWFLLVWGEKSKTSRPEHKNNTEWNDQRNRSLHVIHYSCMLMKRIQAITKDGKKDK